jgi:glyoxylase-like metal-dependent hydrolase (beta-lactamase superfamily II)
MMKKKTLFIAGVPLLVIVVCGLFMSIGYQKFMSLDAVEYDPELEILLGGGGNSIVLTSEDGAKALVVDTKMGSAAKKMSRRVKAKEIVVVNTHCHHDHIGGNARYPNAKIIAGAYTKEAWAKAAGKSRYPDETVNVGEEKIVQVGSEAVHIRNMGQAHTSNDVVVYLEKRKMLVAGDVVFIKIHPVLFGRSGCSVASWIGVLDSLCNRYEIRALVPGHGGVSDKNALLTMKEYFTSIGNALADPQKLAALKKKYNNYSSVPGMSGFGKTVAFVESERNGK